MLKGKRLVLVCDDEPKMLRAIKDFLQMRDFAVITAENGEEALEIYYENNQNIDLVLLDVMMPNVDGLEVLENLRLNGSLVPVIMLTARGEEYDQLKGFSLGADDYITKPFSPSLLIARIDSVLKRVGKAEETEISVGAITLNLQNRNCTINDANVPLKKREFELLYYLMLNQNLVFSREQLLSSVWGYEFEGDIRTVDTHVKQLRMKLGDLKYIRTIHGVGYKFELQD